MIKPTYIPIINLSDLHKNKLLTSSQFVFLCEADELSQLISVEEIIEMFEERVIFDDLIDEFINLKQDEQGNKIYINLDK